MDSVIIGQVFHLVPQPFTESKSPTWDGHFSVKLFMGSGNSKLNWDIKMEDFEAVEKQFLQDGRPVPWIVNPGFSTHNTMCFQYIKKESCEYCFNVLKNVLEKRLLKK